MDLEQIQLEKVMGEEYRRLAKKWKVHARKPKYQVFWGKITRTFYARNYEDLIEDFLHTQFAYRIDVRGKKGEPWNRTYLKTDQSPIITDQKIKEIANIARSNPYKRGFFEFKVLDTRWNEERRLLEISFSEVDGNVLLTDISVPAAYKSKLSLCPHLEKISFQYLNGILAPSARLIKSN